MVDKLEACPFCGKQPTLTRRVTTFGLNCFGNEPSHFLWSYGGTEAEAIAAWNTRATPSERVRSLEAILQFIARNGCDMSGESCAETASAYLHDARLSPSQRLARDSYAAALEALMASSGARGTYDAAKYYEATKEAERLLGNKETDRHG